MFAEKYGGAKSYVAFDSAIDDPSFELRKRLKAIQ